MVRRSPIKGLLCLMGFACHDKSKMTAEGIYFIQFLMEDGNVVTQKIILTR